MIRSRHGAYLDRWYREHEQRHNDGVNRLVVRFAREGAEVVAGWRGEVNVPGLTQVRPDLLVQVSEGTLGAGIHFIEFERVRCRPTRWSTSWGPTAGWRRREGRCRCWWCARRRGDGGTSGPPPEPLPMLTATQERAFAGPVTGAVTVWSRDGVPAALHYR